MALPSLKNAEKLAYALKHDTYTIGCMHCKRPMWSVKIKGRYGSRIDADKTPFEGVPPYSEYWDKDQRTALRTDCPFCGKDYFSALMANGHVFPKTYIVEFGE